MSRALSALVDLSDSGSWATLDTETTGLGIYDVVVEVALVDCDGSLLYESLARPERSVTAKAAAVHGLSRVELDAAPSWSSVWTSLQPLLRGRTVLAWNMSFDLRLLRQTCDRHDLPFQAPRSLCLRAAFGEKHPHIRGTLDAACLTLGCSARPSHRARQDAEVARQVAIALMAAAGAS